MRLRPATTCLVLACLFQAACQHKVVAYGEIDEEVVVDLVTEVARIRALWPRRPVRVRLQRARELRASVERDLADRVASGEHRRTVRAWAKVGLVPWAFDLAEYERRTFTREPAGYYVPEEGRLYVVDRPAFRSDLGEVWGAIVGRDPVHGEALAHEVAHALVDQHMDLHGLLSGDLTSDQTIARRALAEGDATRVGFEWSGGGSFANHLDSLEERLALVGDDDTPEWLRARISLPYLSGGRIVERLRRHGGWAAVDAAYSNPPASSEQLLHPELYPRDAPIEIRIPDDPLGNGSGRRVLDDTLGEIGMRCVLRRYLRRESADAAAAGWGGDAVGVWETGNGMLLLWRSAWDTERDAAEWLDAYATLVEKSYVRGIPRAALEDVRVWSTDEGLVGVERCGTEVLVYEGVPDEELGALREAVDMARPWGCSPALLVGPLFTVASPRT